MAAPAAKQPDLRKKLAQKDEALRKKLEADLAKKRAIANNQGQATVRRGNLAAVKGTLGALKPAPVLTVPEAASVTDACQLCATKKTDCALIIDDDRLIGIVTSQDLTYRVIAEGHDPRTTLIRHVMTLDPVACPESCSVSHGLDLMISKKINHLPITNEDGKVVGVVDFMKVFFEILSHAFRKASASNQLLSAMTGVQTELGTDGSNAELLSWAHSLRQKTALPDLPSIMSTHTQPVTVSPKASVREAAQLMKTNYITAVCIMDDAPPGPASLSRQAPRLSGIFTTKDVVLRVIAAAQDAARCSVVRVMTPQPDKARLTLDIYDAAKMMHGGNYFHLPVVEDDDRLVAVFDIQTLAEATQEQVKGANQGISMPDAAKGPMWGRFFDSIGSTSALSALPGTTLLFGSPPRDPNDQLPPPGPEGDQSLDSDLHPGDSISVVDEASASGANSAGRATNKGANNPQDPIPPVAGPSTSTEQESFTFKFRTPAGLNYRLFARQDDYNGLKILIGEKLATDPMFDTDPNNTTGVVPDPNDFKFSYTDDDEDAVLIDSDRDVLDAVNMARKASSDRVMLIIHPGKSWTTPVAGAEKEKSEKPAAVPEPPPPTESKPEVPVLAPVPVPVPAAAEPNKVVAEVDHDAPPMYTEREASSSNPPLASAARGGHGMSPNAASKLEEILRGSLGNDNFLPLRTAPDILAHPGSSGKGVPPLLELPTPKLGKGSKTAMASTDEKKGRLRDEGVTTDNVKTLGAYFALVFSDTYQYKRLAKSRGKDAQKLLDTFQTLLDIPGLDAAFRRNLLVATQRLSRDSGLYPSCYTLQDIASIDKNPVAAGGFADIHKGRLVDQTVCLKIIRVYQSSEVDTLLKRLAPEAILWGQLSHPNLLPIYGLYQYDKRLCLVSPWMNNGNINEYLHDHPGVNRTLLVSDIASGIAYLHGHEIVHGDLKGANILVDSCGRARLADFGISAISDSSILPWSSHSVVGSQGGSTRWQAPELFNIESDTVVHNTMASDVYSYACVVYEVFSGNAPFSEIPREPTVIIKIRAGDHPSRPSPQSLPWSAWGLTEAIWSLMEACWNAKPEKRPDIRSIISDHQFETLEDDRSRNVDDILFPANFRDSVGARAALPSVNDIEAIMDAVNMETETPLASPPLPSVVAIATN